MPQTSSFIRSEDGTLLHLCRRPCDREAAVCLLIHGYGDAGYVWSDVCEALAHVSASITLDLRGHGDSERSRSGGYTLDEYASDARSALAAITGRPLIVIGHSLGGLLAIHLAARHPEAVAGLLLVDVPEPSAAGIADLAVRLRQGMRVYGSVDEYAAHLMSVRPLLPAPAARALAARALRPCDGGFEPKIDPEVVAAHPRALAAIDEGAAARMRALLPQIACPAVVVRGAASAVVTATAAARMAGGLARGRLVTIARAGHAVMTDNAGLFTRVTRDFVESVARSTAAAGS